MMRVPEQDQIMIALTAKFGPPRYAFFEQTGDAVGFPSRRADAVAVAMWRSLGLEIHGFEIKVARQDWLREIKNPDKAESVFRYCDRWWLVISDRAIVKNGELPGPWGLMCLHGRGLKTVIAAPKLKPMVLTHAFLAGILRKVDQQGMAETKLHAEFERGYARAAADLDYHKGRADKSEKVISQYELASGLSMRYNDPPRVGATVRMILNGGAEPLMSRLESLQQQVRRLADEMEENIRRIKGEAKDRADGS